MNLEKMAEVGELLERYQDLNNRYKDVWPAYYDNQKEADRITEQRRLDKQKIKEDRFNYPSALKGTGIGGAIGTGIGLLSTRKNNLPTKDRMAFAAGTGLLGGITGTGLGMVRDQRKKTEFEVDSFKRYAGGINGYLANSKKTVNSILDLDRERLKLQQEMSPAFKQLKKENPAQFNEYTNRYKSLHDTEMKLRNNTLSELRKTASYTMTSLYK